LPSKIELGKFVLKWNGHEHHMFMKKDKLVHKTIFLNVVIFFLHLQHMQNWGKSLKQPLCNFSKTCSTIDYNSIKSSLQC
jgi:hypothetical protein